MSCLHTFFTSSHYPSPPFPPTEIAAALWLKDERGAEETHQKNVMFSWPMSLEFEMSIRNIVPPQKKTLCGPRVCLCQLLKGGILSFLLINYSVKCCVVSFVGSIASDFYSLAHKKNIFVIGNSCCVPAPRANNFRRQALIFNLMSSTPLSCSSLWLLGLLQHVSFCTGIWKPSP